FSCIIILILLIYLFWLSSFKKMQKNFVYKKPSIFKKKDKLCIHIIGVCSSGKSTLCKKLAKTFNLNHQELDELFWRPNWKKTSAEEQVVLIKEKIEQFQKDNSKNGWVFDGNYKNVRPKIWENANIIIWLDYDYI